MQQTIFKLGLLLLLLSTFTFNNCTQDKLPEPVPPGFCDTTITSYNLNIKPIIDNSCAYSGCHLDTAPGNFTTYEGASLFFDKFQERVINLKDDEEFGMPPFYTPSGRPVDLTQEEFDLMTCWINAGFPED
jgi:hypothetical protein